MARFYICRFCGDTHQRGRTPDNCRDTPWPRSDYPAPFVVSDSLPGGVNGLYHHGACRKFDSKSEFRRATAERGLVEMGNSPPPRRQHVELGRDVIESAVNEALHRHAVDDGKGDDCITVEGIGGD